MLTQGIEPQSLVWKTSIKTNKPSGNDQENGFEFKNNINLSSKSWKPVDRARIWDILPPISIKKIS